MKIMKRFFTMVLLTMMGFGVLANVTPAGAASNHKTISGTSRNEQSAHKEETETITKPVPETITKPVPAPTARAVDSCPPSPKPKTPTDYNPESEATSRPLGITDEAFQSNWNSQKKVADGNVFYLNICINTESTKSDTTVKLCIAETAKKIQMVYADVTTSDISPKPAKRLDVSLESDSLFYLEPVENEAALLYEYGTTAADVYTASLNHKTRPCIELGNCSELFSDDGLTINGKQYSDSGDKPLVLSLKMRAVYYQDFALETKACKVKDNQEIDVTVTYKNNSNVKQENVSLNSLATIDLMETVPGSVVLTSPGYPNGISLDDEGAYSIGDFKPGEEATLTYRLKLLDNIDLDEEGREGTIVSDCYVGNDLRITSTSFTVTKEGELGSIASVTEDTGEHAPLDKTENKQGAFIYILYGLPILVLILVVIGLLTARQRRK